MHEMSFCRSVLEVVRAHAQQRGVHRVAEVTVEVGELRSIASGNLRYYFDLLKTGTVAGSATLNVERVPGEGECAECQRRFALVDGPTPCPACGSLSQKIVSGNELRVKSIRAD